MMAGVPFADLLLMLMLVLCLKTFPPCLLLYGTRGCLALPLLSLLSLSLSLFCIARCMNSHSSVRLDSLQKVNSSAQVLARHSYRFVKLCWLPIANNPGICLLFSGKLFQNGCCCWCFFFHCFFIFFFCSPYCCFSFCLFVSICRDESLVVVVGHLKFAYLLLKCTVCIALLTVCSLVNAIHQCHLQES